ncbi:hypothetical protein SAMN02745225_02393, partial [Ferrithrix thermotolerans DSM 19514]
YLTCPYAPTTTRGTLLFSPHFGVGLFSTLLGQGGTPEEPVNGTSSDTGTEEPQYFVATELPEVQII